MKRVDVVYALIYDDTTSKVLMVGNRREHGSEWSLPGGARERGETLGQAVIRETFEETGLNVAIDNIVAINEKFFPHAHAVFFTFGARIIGGEQSINDPNEITDIRWIDIKEAENIMDYFPNGVQCFVEQRVAAPYYFQAD
ncbi:NUDIX domain-containing protein [Geomicrobium sp. JCM 19055]|uniref:NUDIX domain-containing protein n=1 Tax=Geomicrobium sp. JCM 19055 TaxID=1460649 RepID=UPI00045ED630|nr:NUDIX hydrolase [Geomicrobium sp. JCM 19055]GAK00589.1 Nudix hydrolase family protein [Geomicrobium sp. JCM 19055]